MNELTTGGIQEYQSRHVRLISALLSAEKYCCLGYSLFYNNFYFSIILFFTYCHHMLNDHWKGNYCGINVQ